MPSKGFAKNHSQKAQAGLEYLITYGWALVAIATIIGVLVCRLNPKHCLL